MLEVPHLQETVSETQLSSWKLQGCNWRNDMLSKYYLNNKKKTDMVKNMLLVGSEGETLDLDGSVVGKEKAMRENPRK